MCTLTNSEDPYELPHLDCFMVISGPEFGWARKMGQWPMSYSFACKNQDFDGQFEILMGHLVKKMGPRNLNIYLTAK